MGYLDYSHFLSLFQEKLFFTTGSYNYMISTTSTL
jgi:hypothetical protein